MRRIHPWLTAILGVACVLLADGQLHLRRELAAAWTDVSNRTSTEKQDKQEIVRLQTILTAQANVAKARKQATAQARAARLAAAATVAVAGGKTAQVQILKTDLKDQNQQNAILQPYFKQGVTNIMWN